MTTASGDCAIDFGTSNSAIAVPDAAGGMRLVELEPGQTTMPTAVFYFVEGPELDGPPRAFGRAAIAAYVDGLDGRLMRSMKSILGSPLIDQTTDVGGGRGVKYLDIVAGYLKHLKRRAEAQAGAANAAESERYYNEALRIDPKHKGALEYSGELYLMMGDLPKAEQRLTALDKACFLPCSEYKDLKNAVAKYKANGNKYVGDW